MFKKKERGQSAVEFALVVTIAIIMFLGMMQFGMYLYGLSIVENAARNGARHGIGKPILPILRCHRRLHSLPCRGSR